MKDFKEFVELEEGLKPEHNMRPGWMIKADPVLKAKIEANKKKQKEMKAILGNKLKEELEEETSYLPQHHIMHVTASKDGGSKEKMKMTVRATSKAEAKGVARLQLKKKGYEMHSATHHGIDYSWLKKEETITEGAYEKSEENKRSADSAKKQGDMFAHHLHMADHHDNLAQWHGEKGRHGEADKHTAKAEEHHEKAMALKEEVVEEAELEEGLLKSVKRAVAGWGAFDKDKPADVVNRVKGHDTDTLKKLSNRGSTGKGSPAELQQKAISRELKKRGVAEEVESLDELSNDTLASYKKKAGESASEADKKGDFEKGHKRFKGIMKATFKQFANDAKK